MAQSITLKLKLPAAPQLTQPEIVVLAAHAQLKSTYRSGAYQSRGLLVRGEDGKNEAEKAIEKLVQAGLLSQNINGATAITTAGKNALNALPGSTYPRF